jgi:hypothetical protein
MRLAFDNDTVLAGEEDWREETAGKSQREPWPDQRLISIPMSYFTFSSWKNAVCSLSLHRAGNSTLAGRR